MTATLLQIATALAVDVGLAVPTAVASATDATNRTMVEAKQVIDFVGEEAARRVDWAALRATTSVVGTGSAASFTLPAAYSRMTMGNAVIIGGVTIRGGLSAEEFLSLTAVAGTPRFYLISGPPDAKTIQFWPTLANGVTVNIIYQIRYWNSVGPAEKFTLDTDTAYLPDQIMIKGSIARWRRQKGMDYADYQSEYEMVLQNYAIFDDNARSP